MVARRTVVIQGRLAMADGRLAAARRCEHGVQFMTVDRMVARLAGGFARPVDDETLKGILGTVLTDTDLGELDPIKALPGMIDAAAETLRKAWLAAFDLSRAATPTDRIASVHRLEEAVLARLPVGMMRPVDLAEGARARLLHAPHVLGPVEIVGLADIAPCWRGTVAALVDHVPVTWVAGPRAVPDWVRAAGIRVVTAEPENPVVAVCSAATPRHEVLEALRWARELMASGQAEPADIAVAACRTEEYDDVVLALRAEANLDVRFVHGVPAASVREGQAAAALADILIRGISQDGIRRLAALLREGPGPFASLPERWTRILPREAPLTDLRAWERLLSGLGAGDFNDGHDHTGALRDIVGMLARGPSAAAEAGEKFLHGLALRIWRKALIEGAAAVIDLTLGRLRIDDGADACASVVWAPASALAAAPRRFVRLLGLSSRGWPQVSSEDRLLSDHLVPSRVLDPFPRPLSDRSDFHAILATSAKAVVLSRPRRGPDGRLLGRSPLLRDFGAGEAYLGRNRIPPHAVGELDRLMARPEEFRATAQARSASSCWRAWGRAELTPHDGRVRPDHPVVLAILGRTHSASSLRKLLRDPLGFVWTYGLGLGAADPAEEPLTLDHRAFGSLVHEVLERAVLALEADGGFARATEGGRRQALAAALDAVAGGWERERPIPPRMIWRQTLDRTGALALAALTHPDESLAGQQSWVEVPFGGQPPKRDHHPLPWDFEAPVTIPGTGFRISGYIDRLDLSHDRGTARVRDYKTGKPCDTDTVLAGGRELQRCLYGYATRVLLGSDVSIDASLHFPHEGLCIRLDQPDDALDGLAAYLLAARESLRAGHAFAGPDAQDPWNDLAFALPANADQTYCRRKHDLVRTTLGEAARVWEAA
ncbi:PD-(D/E)XK nuclease family protein [Methylobacterium durans]|nr:PD-(D/E)XK nuclease family protein [Methylobacterium durans]